MPSNEITRRDWQHGEARCPSCGLHLDPVKDLEEKIIDDRLMLWVGVRGKHQRCGRAFELFFPVGVSR